MAASDSPDARTDARTDEQLEGRLAFESLISDTSALLMTASTAEVTAAIDDALTRVRTFFKTDRCALLTVSPDRHTVNVSFASYASGVSPVSGSLNLAAMFPWQYQRVVVEGVPSVVPRVADMPPEAALDRANATAMGTRSTLVVPISSGAGVSHLIVIHAVFEERDWPVEYVPRLRVLGSLMATAVQRQEAFDAVREGEARLREHAARLAAAFDAAELGFAEWRALDAPPFLDARMRDLFGLGPGEEDRLPEWWLSRIDETSRASVLELRRRVFAGEIDRATAEYRYEHPVRGSSWLRHTWRRVVGDAATEDAVTLVGAALDITESRAREEALQAAHEDVKRLRDRLERENVYLRRQALPAHHSELVTGRSPAIAHALDLAGQVAATTSTVLLIGETGTGKERFAAHIHEASPRRARAMVRVNCSAIPAALIESELFGREKGAYTGALSKQIGRFELANGSTLFLDEIGDLPLDVQVKLLRVLQERTIERLGNPASIAIDVRIIAASNRDLDAAVRAGTFRNDLYYRLNVFPITVPPLRERREDIPALAGAIVQELSVVMRRRFDGIDGAGLEALTTYDWPGNVRELRNVLERAMILSPGPILTVAPPHGAAAAPRERDARAGSRDLRELEREHILRVLEETGWRIRGQDAAAAKLGLKPTTLEARMAKLGIRRPGAKARS